MALALKDVLSRANKRLNVSGMDKDVVKIVQDVIKELHKQGIYLGVAQAYRSKAEQDALYAQGRTKPGPIVTGARGGQSNHNFGVAVDVFVYPDTFNDAKFLEPSDERMKKIVAAMKKRGMKWGGDWKSFPDYPHFELYDAYRGEKKPSVSSKPSPAPSKPSAPASSSDTHKVVYGDTLSGIGKKYGVSVTDLKVWNGLKSSDIYPGDVLKLKKPKEAPAKSIVPYPGKPLYNGAKGMDQTDIERIQRAVGAKVTGKYDAQTTAAVKKYQARHKLVADGIFGKKSWEMAF